MPEGDTIHAVARIMAPDLVGQALERAVIDRRPRPGLDGAVVESCDAIGKHLVISMRVALGFVEIGSRQSQRLAKGSPCSETGPTNPSAGVSGAQQSFTLRVHLGMKGSWHRYRPGETWRRGAAGARVELHTASWVFVCFGPKDVELVGRHPNAGPRLEGVARLGPDLLAASFDVGEVVARARGLEHRDAAIADLLLTQTVGSGIGNVYKSEVLFLVGVHPWTAVHALADERLVSIYIEARRLMQENLAAGGPRVTTGRRGAGVPDSERYWVYRRTGRPCRRCGTAIEGRMQGAMARWTWWCPRCQAP